MPVKSIQLGQLWRHDVTGLNYLVTKVYDEVFAQYAVLRKADGNPGGDTVRVKVQKSPDGAKLPGYTYTQDLQEF
jgi:hypothetical protein